MSPRERTRLIFAGRLRPRVVDRYGVRRQYLLYLDHEGLIGVSDNPHPPERWTILERGMTQAEAEWKFEFIYDLEKRRATRRQGE